MVDKFVKWGWSNFGCDTAYFYFKNQKGYLCVEFWTDENTCAKWAQQYDKNGEAIEDVGQYLTTDEIHTLTKFCEKKIKEE